MAVIDLEVKTVGFGLKAYNTLALVLSSKARSHSFVWHVIFLVAICKFSAQDIIIVVVMEKTEAGLRGLCIQDDHMPRSEIVYGGTQTVALF